MDELELWIEAMQHRIKDQSDPLGVDGEEILSYMIRLAELVRDRTRPPQ